MNRSKTGLVPPASCSVRGYSEDLDTLAYSTLATGDWDPETQQGASNARLYDVILVVGRVLALGIHATALTTTS